MKTPNNAQLELIRSDADKGIALAQMTLGYIYLTGKGTARNYAEAFRWYTRAAQQDNVIAQVKLAGLYWRGHGVNRNPAAASAWYSIASANGYRPWHHRLASYLVRKSLTLQEQQEAQRIVNEWLSKRESK